MNTHIKRVKSLYSSWADQYDESSSKGAPYLLEEGVWIDLVDPKANEKILDIGCGTGRITTQIYKFTKKITGIDISKEMLAIAQRKLPEVTFQQINIEDGIPYNDNTFDKVISSLTFQFLSDIKFPLTEIRRVLKPNGVAYISDFVEDAPLDWSDIKYKEPKIFKGSISSISKFRKLSDYIDTVDKLGFTIVGIKPLRVKENLKAILAQESYEKVFEDWASVIFMFKK